MAAQTTSSVSEAVSNDTGLGSAVVLKRQFQFYAIFVWKALKTTKKKTSPLASFLDDINRRR